MKTPPLFCYLGLLLSTQLVSHAALNRQDSILGKFIVAGINGSATCVSDGRILELKKGDTIVARGAVLETSPKAHVVLVFSNGTGVYVDEQTQLHIEKFEQEFFAPNNNLRVEPSNSSTVARLTGGRVIISTPRLLSATTMNYQTAHASVMIRGDKILIEAAEKRTHVAMISGSATVNPRDARGDFVAVGKRLVTGQEAFVKPTIGHNQDPANTTPGSSDVNAAGAGSAEPTGDAAGASSPVSIPLDVAQARVLAVSGTASVRQPDALEDAPLTPGSLLSIGSIVVTGEAGELHLQPFPGAIATILPNSVVQVERLTLAGPQTAKQSAVLALRTGALVSTIDPAGAARNEYIVRTLQGTARARGTAFATALGHGGILLPTTASTVSFTDPSGTRHQIVAGNVVVGGPSGETRPPVPFAQAIVSHPGLGGLIQSAFSTMVGITRDNLGGLSAGSSLNLLMNVSASAASALPSQAEQLATDALAVIAAPASALAMQVAPATGAVVHAVTAAAPDRAPRIAATAASAFSAQAVLIAAAAGKGAPGQAVLVAFEVSRSVLEPDPLTGVTAGTLQDSAAIAAAITASNTNQAGPVAAAAMQAVLQATSNPVVETTARQGALIAATVTHAAPGQAIQIARAMMRALMQDLTEPTPAVLARMATLLAGSIIDVVPPQAQPVATAVMQFLFEAYPNASRDMLLEIGGELTGTIAQLVPGPSVDVYAGVAQMLGVTPALLEANGVTQRVLSAPRVEEIREISRNAARAFQLSSEAMDALLAGLQLAQSPADASGLSSGEGGYEVDIVDGAGGSGSNNATSIIITQFDPNRVSQLTSDLEAAQAAQTTVQFYTEATSDGGITVRPAPTIPRAVPVENVASPSTIGF